MAQTLSGGQERGLDFSTIEKQLDTLLVALENKIDREWPKRLANIDGARELLLVTARVTRNTYLTIRWICADKPRDPSRKLQYSVSVPPLTRTILDSIFTVIFLLEDLPARCVWYYKAGWRESKLEFERYREEYGNLAEWKQWLDGLSSFVESGKAIFRITPAEANDPARIPQWPNPGKMPRYEIKAGTPLPPERKFLMYLNDWFYRDLSQQSHLGGYGLTKRGAILLADFYPVKDIEDKMKKYKSDQVFTTINLVLALVSEVESHLHFGLVERIRYLWGILIEYSDEAKELYEKRYSSLLVAVHDT